MLQLKVQSHHGQYQPGSRVKCMVKISAVDSAKSPIKITSLSSVLVGAIHVDSSRVRMPPQASLATFHECNARLHTCSGLSAGDIGVAPPKGSFLFVSPPISLSPENFEKGPLGNSTDTDIESAAVSVSGDATTETPTSSFVLCAGEEKNFVVAWTLPDGLPPTFRGQCVRFLYDVYTICCWKTSENVDPSPSQKSSFFSSWFGAEPSHTVEKHAASISTLVRCPIAVTSQQATISLLRMPFLDPDQNHFFNPRAALDDAFQPASLGVAPPLSDVVSMAEGIASVANRGTNPSQTATQSPGAALFWPTVSALNQIGTHQVTFGGAILATVQIWGTAVHIDGNISGIIRMAPKESSQLFCSVAMLTIFMDELIPCAMLKEGTKMPPEASSGTVFGGGDGRTPLIAVSRHEVSRSKLLLLNCAQLPFTLPLPSAPNLAQQTIRTDCVEVHWILQMNFSLCHGSGVSSASESVLLEKSLTVCDGFALRNRIGNVCF